MRERLADFAAEAATLSRVNCAVGGGKSAPLQGFSSKGGGEEGEGEKAEGEEEENEEGEGEGEKKMVVVGEKGEQNEVGVGEVGGEEEQGEEEEEVETEGEEEEGQGGKEEIGRQEDEESEKEAALMPSAGSLPLSVGTIAHQPEGEMDGAVGDKSVDEGEGARLTAGSDEVVGLSAAGAREGGQGQGGRERGAGGGTGQGKREEEGEGEEGEGAEEGAGVGVGGGGGEAGGRGEGEAGRETGEGEINGEGEGGGGGAGTPGVTATGGGGGVGDLLRATDTLGATLGASRVCGDEETFMSQAGDVGGSRELATGSRESSIRRGLEGDGRTDKEADGGDGGGGSGFDFVV